MLDDVTNDGAYGVRLRRPLPWSGRRESNPQHLAWEASTLPLSYARAMSEFWQNLDRPPRKLWSMLTRPEAWEAGILPLNYGRPAPLSYTDPVGAISRP